MECYGLHDAAYLHRRRANDRATLVVIDNRCESDEEKCVDIWSIIKRTGVYGTKQWHGNFSMARCISRCLRNSSCLAVDYNQDIGGCYHLDNSTHLPPRVKNEHLTHITKESRCPRPECTDPVSPCKNGGVCEQHSTGDITCQCAPGYNGLYCEISGEEECVDRWLVFGNTRVAASVKWDGRFFMSSCILKCHRDMACLAVNYIQDQGECYYLNNAADLHNRSAKDHQTVIVIGSRCPRPGCVDTPCKNGGKCTEMTTGLGGVTCQCVRGYTGSYCDEKEPCVDVWSELKGTGISGTTTWEDHFSLTSCFARCLKMNQSACQAVQYLRSTRKCSYLHEDEHLHTRTHNNDLTLLVKESRCPRPKCTDIMPACRNGGTCAQVMAGTEDVMCQCASGYKGLYCDISENDECVNTWVIFKSVAVFQTTIWEGNFSIASCIYRCLENKTCVAVNYYEYVMECYGLHDVTHLHRRRANFRAILAVIENRCRSECTEGEPPCKNGGTCTEMTSGITCKCVPGYTGLNCEVEAECVEDWSIIRNTGVYDTKLWDGKFSMEDCISKCYRDRACLGVNYFQYVLECYYIHNATLLLRRGRSEYLTLILRERRCPRPSCADDPSPCKHGGRCSQITTGDVTCRCAPDYKGTYCDISEDDVCVDRWVAFNKTAVVGTTRWEGNFSMASCILKCLRDRRCLAVNYFAIVWECYYLHSARYLRRRGHNVFQTLVVIDNRCQRPACTDVEHPCKNGGTCTDMTTGAGGVICKCVPGFSGQYCDRKVTCSTTWHMTENTAVVGATKWEGFYSMDSCISKCLADRSCVAVNHYKWECSYLYNSSQFHNRRQGENVTLITKEYRCPIPECGDLEPACLHGGTCIRTMRKVVPLLSASICRCVRGYKGAYCEIKEENDCTDTWVVLPNITLFDPLPKMSRWRSSLSLTGCILQCFRMKTCPAVNHDPIRNKCFIMRNATQLDSRIKSGHYTLAMIDSQCPRKGCTDAVPPCKNGGACVERAWGIGGVDCICPHAHKGKYCEEKRECLDTWSLFKDKGVLGSTPWAGEFSIDGCILKCLQDEECPAVNYFKHSRECWHQYNVTRLDKRASSAGSTLLVRDTHCPKPACKDPVSPCRNGGQCLQVTTDDMTCRCPPNYKGKYCEVTAEDECVDSWSVHRDTTVDGPIMWQGIYTLASCILKCLRDKACLAVTYLLEERTCNYVRMASVLRLRRQTDAQTTLVIIDSRCPACTDVEPPCKNGGTCSQITTGIGGVSCACASGFKGQYCGVRKEEACVDKWRVFKYVAVWGTKKWPGIFTLNECIFKCLRDKTCIAANYLLLNNGNECYGLHDATYMPRRASRDYIHLIYIMKRCPRPECTDADPPCKNGGTCVQITTGKGGVTCRCVRGYEGKYCENLNLRQYA